jgi:hypothetical protein
MSPRHVRARRILPVLGGLAAGLVLVMALFAASASAAEGEPAAKPWWHLEVQPAPTLLQPGKPEQIVEVIATNFGTAPVSEPGGSPAPVKISDKLPPGLTATAIAGVTSEGFNDESGKPPHSECVLATLTCEWNLVVPPFSTLTVVINVEVSKPEGAVEDEAAVEGGTAAQVSLKRQLHVSEAETKFGIENYELLPENADGSPDQQGGSHPFQLTTTLDFNQTTERTVKVGPSPTQTKVLHTAPALPKDVSVKLPPGLVANATAVKQCSASDFSTIVAAGDVNGCAADTAVGVATVIVSEPKNLGFFIESVPVFNLKPAVGEPARFGFETTQVPVVFDTALEAGGEYHAVVSVKNASQAVTVLGTQVTIWGAPADKLHDSSRGWGCIDAGRNKSAPEGCVALGIPNPPAFLILPTVCGQMESSALADSWSEPGAVLNSGAPATEDPRWKKAIPTTGLLGNCGELPFNPMTEVQPDSEVASTPTGLSVKVKVPQEATLSAATLAEADVKDTVVTLPRGVQASPGAANGLEACTVVQSGFKGLDSDKPPLLETELTEQLFTPEPVSCPDGSKIGSVEIITPLLENHLTGSVYLASQDTNPFGTPLVLYLIAEDPVSGVRIKLAGDVAIDQSTGQLTSTFNSAPPLPFSELNLHLFDGSRASQSTPPLCGSYTTATSLTPSSGNPAVASSPSFNITQGAGGGPCETSFPQSFAPAFQAGPVNSQAGAFSTFTLTINHSDADQQLSGVTTTLPAGAAAMLSSVTPCAEPPAGQEWSCGAGSLIGHSSTSSGFGSMPFTLGGLVYLTTGYDGAPFGLLVSTNAEHAGPFNLGVINVRSRINVNKETAAVTITTDPGPRNEILPTFLKGVPVQLKSLTVNVDRPGFEFNPTSCTPQSITGRLSGAEGGSEAVSSPYAVSNCGSLPFKPTLTASTQGNSTKANGASLFVKITSAPGQANIGKTVLVLPIALPSRLTTIQKACVDAVFNANPAACDEGSNIGTAVVHTPVLKNPLVGPAYLVSHGGAEFPDVEFVLQGEGITLVLDGKTNIKKGITTSNFESVPDAPVTTFETTLPEGPHSALSANVAVSKNFNLCGTNLVMPTTITGQNGVVLKQETKIAIQGCAQVLHNKVKKLSRAQKLKKALKACKTKKNKSKRVSCEKQARKKYGPLKKKAKKKSSKKKK